MSKAKQKGTLAETAVVRYLRERGFDVHRQVLTGARDEGDIRGLPVAVEVKNCAVVAMPAWLREARAEADNAGLPVGVVVHHPKGQGQVEGWHVTLTLADFATLMQTLG